MRESVPAARDVEREEAERDCDDKAEDRPDTEREPLDELAAGHDAPPSTR